MSTDMARLGFDVDTRGLRGARSELRSFGSQASTTSRRVTPLIRAMLPIATVAGFTAAIKTTISTFANYEQSMARVRAVSGATDTEFKKLSARARELGSTTEFSASQAASGLEFFARAGWSAEASIAAIGPTLDLATASSMDLGQAADTTSNIMQGFGIAAKDAAIVADLLAKASASANTDVGQMGQAMKFVAPVARVAGVDIEMTAAAVGFLSDAGLQAGMAGRGLRTALQGLMDPTSKVREQMAAAGVAATDAGGALLPLPDLMDAMAEAGIDAEEALGAMSAQAGTAMATLMGRSSDELRRFAGELKDAEGSAGDMASIIRDSVKGEMQAFGSATEELRISLFETFGGDFRTLMQNATQSVRNFAEFLPIAGSAVDGFSKSNAIAWQGWSDDIAHSVAFVDNAFGTMFSNVSTEGVSMMELLQLAFGNTLINIRQHVQIAAIGVTDMFQRAKVFLTRVGHEAEAEFAALDRARRMSLEEVMNDYDDRIEQMHESIHTSRLERNSIRDVIEAERERRYSANDLTVDTRTLEEAAADHVQTTREASQATNDLTVDTRTLAQAKGELTEETSEADEKIQEIIQSLENEIMALDMTSREQAIFNAELRALSAGAGPEAIATIRRLTGEHYDMAEAQNETTDAIKNSFNPILAQKNMIQNLQREWGGLIYDTLDQGKLNFKSFFDAVIDGYKRMIAELTAKSLINAIFGGGGVSGFLSEMSRGLSGIAGMGGDAGGVAGNVASVGSLASSAGGFISGATGSATGIAAGTVGPPTAAASAGAGFMSSLPSLGTLGMVGAGLGAAALIANRLDSGGTMSSNAGLLVGPAPGIPDDRRFSINSFASGFQGEGFARRTDHNEAQRIIQGFAEVDTMITRAIRAAGGQIDMSGATLGGFDEKGQGSGVFLGTAAEEGSGVSSAPMEEQLNKYARQVAAHAHGLGSETQQMLTQARSLDEIMSILGVDGSHRTGLDFVPRDGYRAELHAGERVQTARAARDSDNVANEIRAMRADYRNIMKSQIKATMQIAKLLDDWDVVGQPETRTV